MLNKFEKFIRDQLVAAGQATQYNVDSISIRIDPLFQLLKKYNVLEDLKEGTILDIGCAYGVITAFMLTRVKARRAVGVDYNINSVSVANHAARYANINCIFLQSDVKALPFATQTFDLVIACDCLLYSSTPNFVVFPEVRRILKKGGVFLLKVTNKCYPKDLSTGLWGIQYLPDFLARRYVKFSKNRSTYIDIRTPSSFQTMRALRSSGFSHIHLHAYDRRIDKPFLKWFAPFFMTISIKPQ
jgi:SAM-dependent methyltransferase